MDDVHRARMTRALDKLAASDIDDLTREQMQDALAKAAKAANGSPDKLADLADAVESLTLGMAHFVAAAPTYARAAATLAADVAVARHVDDCARARPSAIPADPQTAPAIVRRWVEALRPIAWPAAVAAAIIGASGNLPALIEALRAAFAG